MKAQSKLATVIIVNFFKGRRVIESIRSLARQTVFDRLAIVVVDNSCDPEETRVLETAPERDSFTLITATRNLGYPKGCNIGMLTPASVPYVVLSNPDIIWDEADAIRRLIDIIAHNSEIDVLAPTQLNDDGSLVEIARNFPTFWHQVRRRLRPGSGDERHLLTPLLTAAASNLIDVDWLQSSCVLIRRALWDEIGGMNERYFLFMSDIDFCLETWRKGKRVSVTSDVRVRGDGLRASRGGLRALLSNRALRIHLMDAIRYYLAHGFRPLSRHAKSDDKVARVLEALARD